MRERSSKRKAESLLTLLLFAVFALCLLLVLLTGAQAYQRLHRRDAADYEQRTAQQYILSHIRQSDALGAVGVEDFCGLDALVLAQELDGQLYETRIYCYEGWLRELFTAADAGLLPADGEKVLPAHDMELTPEDNTLHISLLCGNGEQSVFSVCLRSGEEVAP